MDFVTCNKCQWTSEAFATTVVPSHIRQQALEHIMTAPDCDAMVMDLRRRHVDIPAAHIEEHANVARRSLEVAPA